MARIYINRESRTNARIVTSISDGTLAVAGNVDGEYKITSSWHAHDHEPWIAAWDYWNTSVVYSGGDDLAWKGWDLRSPPSSPIFMNKRQ